MGQDVKTNGSDIVRKGGLMSNYEETEADTRAERIDPVLAAAGWGQNGSKVRREVICPGRIQSGRHARQGTVCRLRADPQRPEARRAGSQTRRRQSSKRRWSG